MHACVYYRDVEGLTRVLDAKTHSKHARADLVNRRDPQGNTALHIAAMLWQTTARDEGCDARMAPGKSMLRYICQILFENGAWCRWL